MITMQDIFEHINKDLFFEVFDAEGDYFVIDTNYPMTVSSEHAIDVDQEDEMILMIDKQNLEHYHLKEMGLEQKYFPDEEE